MCQLRCSVAQRTPLARLAGDLLLGDGAGREAAGHALARLLDAVRDGGRAL